MFNSNNPFVRARLMMLSSSGPANIAGNNVSTSIFIWLRLSNRAVEQWSGGVAENSIVPQSAQSLRHSITPVFQCACSTGRILFDYFQRAAQALPGAARQQQRSNRVDGHALPANHLPDVLRVQAQLIDSSSLSLDGRDRHFCRKVHQPFDDEFEKALHRKNSARYETEGAAAVTTAAAAGGVVAAATGAAATGAAATGAAATGAAAAVTSFAAFL